MNLPRLHLLSIKTRPCLLVAGLAAAFAAALAPSPAPAAVINNDTFLKDTTGNPIYAQGGGVYKFNGVYYWYGVKYNGAVTYAANPSAGENSDTSFAGFSCYSSTDLVNWKFERLSTAGFSSGWIGRMGVCYNANTQKYILVSQYAGGLLFATSSTPNGTFVYDHVQATLPNVVNGTSGDQTLFLDTDGTPYLICSSSNGRAHLYVLPLNPADYLSVIAGDNIYNGNGREGNMMFKNNGRYYFCSSDLHGWNASHCYVIDSTSILGTYGPEYVMNRTDLDFCHVSQTGFGVTVTGATNTTVLFVGDRWCDFAGNGLGYNQWCPVTFDGATPTFQSVTSFDLDAANGTWSVAPANNYVLNPAFEADRVSQTDVAGWTSSGSGFGNASGSHNPGNFHFRHSNTSAYTATTDQLVTSLPPGTYAISVWYESSGGQPTAQIFARSFGGDEMDAAVNTAQSSWKQLTIPAIPVTNGQCDLGLYSVANANQSVDIDDWSLTLVGPPPPTGLAALSGNGQVPLNWDAASGATAYNVKRSTSPAGPFTTVASPSTNSYTDTSVSNGVTYYYEVSATNSLGESPNTAAVSVVPSAGPIISAVSVNPNPVFPGANVTISVTVTPQANPIASVTIDLSSIGGSASQTLLSDGSGHYTANVTAGATAMVGDHDLTVNALDSLGNVAAPFAFSLAIGTVNITWNGAGATNNWSSGANWLGGVPPSFGYSLTFAGSYRTAPVMDGSYNLYDLDFDNTAAAFSVTTSGGNLTVTGTLSNHSAHTQTLNVPVVLGANVTITAASADLLFPQSIDNGGNLLTVNDGGHNTTFTGPISGSGGLSLSGSGTDTFAGANSFQGDLAIANDSVLVTGSAQLGGGSYFGAITNNGTLTFNTSAAQTLAGIVSGTGGLNQFGPGSLVLSSANVFNGTTVLSGGALTVANALALQNSALNYTGGSLSFATGISNATVGALNSSLNINLVNATSGAVALTVANNVNSTYSGAFTGTGSLTKSGSGTFTASGPNSFSGSVNVVAGTLELPSGGVINSSGLNGAGYLIDGGSLTSSGTASFSPLGNAFLETSGTVSLNTVTESASDGLLIKITGGTFSAASITFQRTANFSTAPSATAPIAAATSSGLYVNGSSANVTVGTATIGNNNSSASARIDAGTVTFTGRFLIGHTTNSRWSILQVAGGTVTSTDTANGIVLSQNNGTTANNSEFYISGGVVTAEKIAFGVSTDTVAESGFLIVGGGTLYLGSGGIIRPNTHTVTSNISLLGGTLGAKADWSTTIPVQLSGNTFTIKAADASGLAQNITLNTFIGSGNATKTGGGALTLTGTSTGTGNLTVSAGSLIVNGTLPGKLVTIQSGATLAGTGRVSANLTVQSGAALLLNASGNLASGNVTFAGNVTVAAAANVTVGNYTLLGYSGNLTGSPAFTYVPPSGASQAATFSTAANHLVTVSVFGPPSAPTGLAATPGTGNISLNWNPSSGATGYTVKRSTTSGSGYSTLATGVTAPSFLDSTAASGTQYYYIVIATNAAGAGTPSSEIGATPAGPPAAAPAGLVATPGNATVALSWNSVGNATSYVVQRSTTSGSGYAVIASGVASSNYTDSGLTNGVTYFYVVAGANAAGSGPHSAEASATPAQSLTEWCAAFFPGVSDANITGPSADPDGDGLSNLAEYLLGSDPTTPDSPARLTNTSADGSGHLVFTFHASKNLTGVTYKIQQSTDLVNWTDTGVTPTIQSDAGAYYIMQAPVPLGLNLKLFLRVVVTAP